jgi:PAS domain S-box-containing protein
MVRWSPTCSSASSSRSRCTTSPSLYQLLQAQKLQPGWTALVWDGNGVVLARSHDHPAIVGTAVGSNLRVQPLSTVFRTTSIEGLEVLAAVRAIAASPWRVGVSFTASVIDRHLRDSLILWGGMILAAATAAVALALFFGRQLTRPLAEVIAAAGALGRRQAFDIRPSRLREANAVVAALQTAARELDESSAALRASEETLRTAAEAADFGPHEYDVAADRSYRSPQMLRLLGVTESPATFEDGLNSVHPEDREQVRRRKQEIISGPAERYELEYRIRRPGGEVRWVMDRGQVIRDGHGKTSRVVGVLLDISRLKEAEARQRLLFDELNHRVKNTLAIVQALAHQTLRAYPDRSLFTREFGARLASLARAHDLLTQESRRGAPLREIMTTAMAPFINEGRSIHIEGDAVTVPANATITLSLMLHELASNAAKHGALSVPEGKVLISWQTTTERSSATVDMEWREENGPAVAQAPRAGFGTRLLGASASQINAELDLDYAQAGLRCRLRFSVPLPGIAGK